MAPSPANSHGNGYPLGLAGAVSATRFVGGTATVAPTTGTFLVGDFVIAQNGTAWICTVAGTPGTWVQLAGGSGSSPLTTKGDVWGFSNVDARIPVGANGTILTADSAQALGVKWGAAGAGTVTSVAATDGSVVVAGTAADPTIATAALNTIAGLKAMSGALAMNAKKITGLADGASAQDAAAWGQLVRQLDYVAITAPVSISATTAATANTCITGSSVTYDGSTVIVPLVACMGLSPGAVSTMRVTLWEDSTDLGAIARMSASNSTVPGTALGPRLTPSAGAHVYTVKAYCDSGSAATFQAGAGGSGNFGIAYLLILKVTT